MKEHNYPCSYDLSIRSVNNGFIVKFNTHSESTEIAKTFTDAINIIARHLGLVNVGEKLVLKDEKKEERIEVMGQ